MHYFKKNIGDYAKKTGRLSMLQHGAYTLLIDSCYDRERFPTLDDAIEWTWASSKEEIEAVEFVLRRFFDLEDGVYVQSRIREEIAEYYAKATTNKRIADEREAKRKANGTTGKRNVHESSPSVDEAPPNQEPLTNNQEPSKEAKASPDLGKPKSAPACPVAEIVEMYNTMLPMLPAVSVVNDSRKRAIAARWREVVTTEKMDRQQGLEFFQWFFKMVKDSKFLTGKAKDWKADIDFLFNPSKFPRIVEGTYHEDKK
jgi:uncharacterized protein YdaU (DUF1376 family)